ncbi:Crp/Fnr family transcriptional regulator [bacterium]|nr:Crp/Fnr family transcriptional regulator [bacterium]MBU1883264.1 Crp/Fnr family transcriptional regulator [bacterium]
MFDRYEDFIKGYISFNIVEWTLFKSRLTLKEFKKGDVILHQGDVCKELYFINGGLARGFVIDESGKDFTWSIFFNDKNASVTNLFVTDYRSFLHQNASTIQIEALENTQIISVSYENVQFLYNNLKKGERFGRLMSEEAYAYLHNLVVERQTKSARERFENFVEKTPFLLEKVPQYHIATFLGITPQHLSRLKKEHKY